jgi:hypothetical protein
LPLIQRIYVQPGTVQTSTYVGTGVDVSGVVTPWTLVLEIQSSAATDGVARFTFQDSVDAFTTVVAGPSVTVEGASRPANERRWSWTQKDFPDMRFGWGSAQLRLALTRISGTNPSIQYSAWVEF